MTYFVINRQDKTLYQSDDKELAIAFKKKTREATNILFQETRTSDVYLLCETHPYEKTDTEAPKVGKPPAVRQRRVSQR
jgi:ribosomal protein RSM22 (predicted rRNA methylase)